MQYSESTPVRKNALGPVISLLSVLHTAELFELHDFTTRCLHLLAQGHSVVKVAIKIAIFEALSRCGAPPCTASAA